jgi:hypothetical protein
MGFVANYNNRDCLRYRSGYYGGVPYQSLMPKLRVSNYREHGEKCVEQLAE